jgi:hypothetical protein
MAKLSLNAPAKFVAAIDEAKEKRFEGRVLNIRPDPPDFRDRFFQPGLVQIQTESDARRRDLLTLAPRDQGDEGSCTGQALAAVIDIQNTLRGMKLTNDSRASARMLYEMARAHDEYPDDGIDGSSARGAIKGFFHNGVCTESDAPYTAGEPGWRLGVTQAKAARDMSLGAYLRLRHVLYDYHAALCEAGAIVVTSMVHDGWSFEKVANNRNRIHFEGPNKTDLTGAHAFAIVGYDADGFLVLNSWGPGWGENGIAHWSYEDWQAHVLDAWVLRLAVPSAKTFHKVGGYDRRHARTELSGACAPARSDIIGHYCHVEDGRFVAEGAYANDVAMFEESAKYLEQIADEGATTRYEHLLLYAHGGLTELESAATYASQMIPTLKAARIYPMFFFWRTGAMGAINDLLFGQSNRVDARAGGASDLQDWAYEKIGRTFVRPIWSEMKADAVRGAFKPGAPNIVSDQVGDAGAATLRLLRAVAAVSAASKDKKKKVKPLKLHIAGHSAGAILMAHLLQRWRREGRIGDGGDIEVATASLLAPACTTTLYNDAFAPLISANTDIANYILDDDRERADTAGPYNKSLLYLVSNALESETKAPILGMKRTNFHGPNLRTFVAGEAGTKDITDSQNHGDYDKDPATLNHIMRRILGKDFNAEKQGFSAVHFELAPPKHGS